MKPPRVCQEAVLDSTVGKFGPRSTIVLSDRFVAARAVLRAAASMGAILAGVGFGSARSLLDLNDVSLTSGKANVDLSHLQLFRQIGLYSVRDDASILLYR